jgi:hypothetical protein
VDQPHIDADPDADPDSTYYPDADPDADSDSTYHPDADPDPSFQIKAQTLEKVLKQDHFPYILACHLQIVAYSDPVPDPAYHFDSDPVFYLMLIKITKKMIRIRIQNTALQHRIHYCRYWRSFRLNADPHLDIGHIFSISDAKKCKNASYHCQTIIIQHLNLVFF